MNWKDVPAIYRCKGCWKELLPSQIKQFRKKVAYVDPNANGPFCSISCGNKHGAHGAERNRT